jgi:hypothetical protein
MDRRSTLIRLAMAGVAVAQANGIRENGSQALDGVWLGHTRPGPGTPPGTPETDTLLFYKDGIFFEDNGAVENSRGQATGNGVQFGFYRFVRSGVFESTSWKIIAGVAGPALVNLQVTIQMISATEYEGELAGSVLDWQGREEGIYFTLYVRGRLLGREVLRA